MIAGEGAVGALLDRYAVPRRPTVRVRVRNARASLVYDVEVDVARAIADFARREAHEMFRRDTGSTVALAADIESVWA